MIGRYGVDSLSNALMVLWLLLAIINIFLNSLIVYVLELICCFFIFFRMFSRNTVKRRRENAVWYALSRKATGAFRHVAVRFRERKTTRFFKCPYCKAPIRMPRKIGRFRITCRKCQESFIKEFKK